jgi:hypothetical protein
MKETTEGRWDTKGSVAANTTSAPDGDLLETVKVMRANAGDGLDDEEFTFFMFKSHLPAEAGFRFLCFHDGCVTFSVPPQDDASWRPPDRWISPDKERIAARVAEKFGLMLSEPPDVGLRLVLPNGRDIRHHLQLSNRKETIVIAHPTFLKIRLYASDTGLVFPQACGLLKDLSALYEPAFQSVVQ